MKGILSIGLTMKVSLTNNKLLYQVILLAFDITFFWSMSYESMSKTSTVV